MAGNQIAFLQKVLNGEIVNCFFFHILSWALIERTKLSEISGFFFYFIDNIFSHVVTDVNIFTPEKYRLPLKYMTGLEKAVKKKGKK